MNAEAASQRTFLGVSALLFVASATVTIGWGHSMSTMGGMEMPGGWTMSMAWMRMPDQTWLGAAMSFLGMWAVMMVAMMLPALMPMLWRYRRAVGIADAGAGNGSAVGAGAGATSTRLGWLTALVALGYFVVWTAVGLAAFPLGVMLANVTMAVPALARAVPIATGVIVVVAGALQFTAWKARQLECCRRAPAFERALTADARTAWKHGLRIGLRCTNCCAGLTATLLVIGVMDLRAMALVTAAITAERLAPGGDRVACVIGGGIVVAGLILTAQAVMPT